jgi:hypothetical protein
MFAHPNNVLTAPSIGADAILKTDKKICLRRAIILAKTARGSVAGQSALADPTWFRFNRLHGRGDSSF